MWDLRISGDGVPPVCPCAQERCHVSRARTHALEVSRVTCTHALEVSRVTCTHALEVSRVWG